MIQATIRCATEIHCNACHCYIDRFDDILSSDITREELDVHIQNRSIRLNEMYMDDNENVLCPACENEETELPFLESRSRRDPVFVPTTIKFQEDVEDEATDDRTYALSV